MASLCLSLLLLFALGSRTGALNVVVETAEEECFYEFLVKGVDLRGSFLVASGGFMDINCEVKGPGDAVLYSVERQTEGHFDIVAADSGEYSVCFSNKASSMVAKSVSFSIHSGAGLPENDVAKKEHLSPLETSVMDLSESLMNVQEEQKFFKARERAHRDTTESTNDRVKWFSLMEAVVLVGMNLWQVSYLRRFFETKRVV